MLNFELCNEAHGLYWNTLKLNDTIIGHIARNMDSEDKYSVIVYKFSYCKIVNECLGKFSTVMEAKAALLKQPIGELLEVSISSD